jgi:SAM-dependent methyltransferase
VKPEDLSTLAGLLACPLCHARLAPVERGLECGGCASAYRVDTHGFIEFRADDSGDEVYDQDTTPEEYAEMQLHSGQRLFDEYIFPLLRREEFTTVLDAGCGMGMGVSKLLDEGYEAFGIDLPNMAKFWVRAKKDPMRFFCADAARLPFRADFFDVVYCMGAFEHIGTINGFFTLLDNYREIRRNCVNELLRVTRPGGRIVVACPNKRFPADIQHPPADEFSRPSLGLRLRSAIYDKTGVNFHPVWGKYHLVSYPEIRNLFCTEGGARGFRPLPLRDYFGFNTFQKPSLKPFLQLARFYLNNLPPFLRGSFLNPYMLVEIRK